MSVITINLPESLSSKLKEAAEKDKVEPEQLIVIAVAEKLASLMTVNYLEERAKRAKLKNFEKILAKVSDTEPEDYDKI
ncbi:MAG: toxin-antitoxin system HicB family antitoxin [Pyrinomonadaceae bacterium]